MSYAFDSVRIKMEREEFIDEHREQMVAEMQAASRCEESSIGHVVASPIVSAVAAVGSAMDQATKAFGHAGGTIGNAFAEGSAEGSADGGAVPREAAAPQSLYRL